MPLQVYQTEDERRYAARLPARAYGSADGRTDGRDPADGDARGGLRPRLLNLRGIAGRMLGGD